MVESLLEFKTKLGNRLGSSADYVDAIDILQAELDSISQEMIDLLSKRSIVMSELSAVKDICMLPLPDRERQIFEQLDTLLEERNKQLKKLGAPELDRETVRGVMHALISFALEAEKRIPKSY